MLVIRLSRQGRRNSPTYRLVAAENSKATDGSFVEILGNYNPIATDQPLVVKKERIEYWLSQGATPSNTVSRLLNKVGFNLPVETRFKAPKPKAEKVKKAVPADAGEVKASEPPVVEEAQVQPPAGDSVGLAEETNEALQPQETSTGVEQQPVAPETTKQAPAEAVAEETTAAEAQIEDKENTSTE